MAAWKFTYINLAMWHGNQSTCLGKQTMRRSSDVMTGKHKVTSGIKIPTEISRTRSLKPGT
jgi:hypothetical protein